MPQRRPERPGHRIDFARFEIDRLRQRKAASERALARLEEYVIETIENLGTDGKGRHRKLEGKAAAPTS